MATVKLKFGFSSKGSESRSRGVKVVRECNGRGRGKGISLLDYMGWQITLLKEANRLGTANNYEKARRSIAEFLGGTQLPLSGLTEELIADYNIFLVRRGLVRNSISFYMRILRALYNKAVRQKLIEQSYPFTEVYTGVDHTRKRYVPEFVISQLYSLDLPAGSNLELARDIFIFSYCMRGMAFVDIAYLKKCNLQNGMIYYTRRKSGQLLKVKVELCVKQIMDRYISSNRQYIFPIVASDNAAEAYQQYKMALNSYNYLLGKLSEMLNCGYKLTSYTSRHSWATAALNHNVPISVISAGMGHTSEQTTRIYLASLENSIIDDVNRGIIDVLQHGVL